MLTFCNGKYQAVRDKYCWTLSEWYEGRSRRGVVKSQKRETYHGTLGQVCSTIIDREAGRSDSLEKLQEMLLSASDILTREAERKNERISQEG